PGSHPTISADGGSVAFLSAATRVIPGQVDANGAGIDVFLYSRTARTTSLVSHAAGRTTATANAGSDPRFGSEPFIFPLVSADGRFAAFLSKATNLVPRQAMPSGAALFLYDRTSGTASLPLRPPAGTGDPGEPFRELAGEAVALPGSRRHERRRPLPHL